MNQGVVVDIGNTRMKWGRVIDGRIADVEALDPRDTTDWFMQVLEWELPKGTRWVLASVHPQATASLVTWLGEESHSVMLLDSHRQIPLALDVDEPESVGLDRLLACAAAKALAPRSLGGLTPTARENGPGPFLVVQAGTALVVNLVNADGAFAGGAILPGLSLMAKSLREHTGLLPEVIVREPVESTPGRTTEAAIRTGIYWAAIGAIRTLRERFGGGLPLYLTGGDAEVLLPAIAEPVFHHPNLVLEGIRLSAEAWP